MNKTSVAILLVALAGVLNPVQSRAKPEVEGAFKLTREDFQLQQDLEKQFTDRIHQAYPSLRFVIVVKLKFVPPVNLSLLGEDAQSRDSSDYVANRIEKVEIYSEQLIPDDVLKTIVNAPIGKVSQTKIEFKDPEKKSEVVATPEISKSVAKAEEKSQTKSEAAGTSGWTYLFLALIAAGIAGAVVGLFRIKKSVGGLSEPISRAIGELQSSGVGGPQNSPLQSGVHSIGASTDAYSRKQRYKSEQLKAMFAECYWCERDQEAAALVRTYPQIEVYQSLRFGQEYLEYLRSFQSGSLDFTGDMYFLNPNPVFLELSPTDTPVQLVRLASKMRFEVTHAGAQEVIEAQIKKAPLAEVPLIKSKLRVLDAPIRVRFKTIEEEAQVLKSSLPAEVKMNLPSLYRLSKLKEQEFTAVIDEMSVQELAQAWIAPDNILIGIFAKIPERKQRLLKQMVSRVSANRESAGFVKMMSLCDRYSGVKMPPQESREAA